MEQTWHGRITDSPKDIRVRQFTLGWRNDFSETNRFKARTESHIVYRAEFHCAGTHNACDSGAGSASNLGGLGDGDDDLVFSDDEASYDGRGGAEEEQAEEVGDQEGASQDEEHEDTVKDQRRSHCTGSSRTCVQYHVSTISCERRVTED